ncbi:branched-chain amino acid ABC transporter permease [Ruminococcaceae bacterium OttesenSCG-928-D13]|nr:branched-chain amino acid ABC transporter permease [Ruminococcaceae bacterium OttesenSCG-928-D13]
MTKTKKRGIASLGTLVVVAAVYVLMRVFIASGSLSAYVIGMINLCCINVIAAVSLNMVTGLMGQLVLGHAGFMLVGAYATSIFAKESGMALGASLPIGLVLAGVLAAVTGLLIGIPALRLRGDYLAIITLGFGKIIEVLARYFKGITNGAKGYSGFPTFNVNKQPDGLFSYVFLVAAFVIFFSYTFGTSRHGRAVLAIREDEIAAENSGINTTYYKLLTFTLSAFFAGVAGGFLAQYVSIIDPSKYDFNFSIEILMMVVLGGMGSITGSVISASVLTLLPELLRGFAQYRMLIYSVVLIIVMLFRPKGLLGRAEIQVIKPFEWLLRKFGKKPAASGKGGEGA